MEPYSSSMAVSSALFLSLFSFVVVDLHLVMIVVGAAGGVIELAASEASCIGER